MRVALASFLCGPDQLFTEGGEVEEKKVLKIQHLCCAGLGNLCLYGEKRNHNDQT